MKVTIYKYLYFSLLLLLAFAPLKTNGFNNISDAKTFVKLNNSFNHSLVKETDFVSSPFLHTTFRHNNSLLFCEIFESSETEDEEPSLKNKSLNNSNNLAFATSRELYINFSKKLQKSLQRPQRVVNSSSNRLHKQYQVFII
ncbi:hypothetical protein [Polaribacter sp.]|uniref:hypothetical protein n=1 Tax=Polaribacter sp. TaxID=1920175 RepID=UPI003F6B051E